MELTAEEYEAVMARLDRRTWPPDPAGCVAVLRDLAATIVGRTPTASAVAAARADS